MIINGVSYKTGQTDKKLYSYFVFTWRTLTMQTLALMLKVEWLSYKNFNTSPV